MQLPTPFAKYKITVSFEKNKLKTMKKTKYAVGTPVKIKENLISGKTYNCSVFVSNMEKFAGKIVTISVIVNDAYRILEDEGLWSWADEMFRPIKYYEFIGGDNADNSFTTGKIYKIVNPFDLAYPHNFIDNQGDSNGYSGANYLDFTPSTKKAFKAQIKHSYELQLEPPIEMQENKWYSFNWDISGKNNTVICRVSKITDIGFHISWRTYLWINSISTADAYRFNQISDLKELSMEEIQQYLPDGHLDKIIVTPTFNVGDWVWHRRNTEAYKITEIIRNSFFKAEFGYAFDSGGLALSFCTKATEKQIKESILKEAKLRYSIGTIFHSAYIPNELTYSVDNKNYCWFVKGAYNLVANYHYGPSIYFEGRWAEIVSKVSVEPKKWDIGTYVVFLQNYGISKFGDVDSVLDSYLEDNTFIYLTHEKLCTKEEKYIKWFATKEEAVWFSNALLEFNKLLNKIVAPRK